MNFKERVKMYLGESKKIRTEMELTQLYKDTAKILGISPSIVREFVTSPHSEDGPGLGLNIVTPRQLAKEMEEAIPDIRE
jgi:hypothetical protein